MRPMWVNLQDIILLHDYAQTRVARMKLQKLTDFAYETFPHPPYSPDLSLTDYKFFKCMDTFYAMKDSLPKRSRNGI